jgi:hypothetical protein
MDNRINGNQDRDRELVEFDAEMPQLDNEDIEFIADDKLEEEIEEEI